MDVNENNAGRLVSLDVFRGLTIAGMILVNNPGSWKYVIGPLRHAEWLGWTPADTVFPSFLFIVGVAITFSFGKRLGVGEKKRTLYLKIFRRALILFTLGLFLNAFPKFDLAALRIPGVLQRIAVCYAIASVIFINTKWKTQLAWAVSLLLLYWAAVEFIPIPELGAGGYVRGVNLPAWIDSKVLEGHMWSVSKTWDPEGILSTVPAISTVLFGILAGHWLGSGRPQREKATRLLMAGAAAVLAGSLWGLWMPIIKGMWTSSYCVLMAGLASICLAAIYCVVDIRGWKRWAQPARVFGRNAITASPCLN